MTMILPIKCQKDHSGRGFFHMEMGAIGKTILANSKMLNYLLVCMRIMLWVKCQKDHSRRSFFHKEIETIGQTTLSKWQNVKLIHWYENNFTSQVAKRLLWKRLFSQKNRDKRPSNSIQMAKC